MNDERYDHTNRNVRDTLKYEPEIMVISIFNVLVLQRFLDYNMTI